MRNISSKVTYLIIINTNGEILVHCFNNFFNSTHWLIRCKQAGQAYSVLGDMKSGEIWYHNSYKTYTDHLVRWTKQQNVTLWKWAKNICVIYSEKLFAKFLIKTIHHFYDSNCKKIKLGKSLLKY